MPRKPPTRKNKIIVDIKNLNKIIENDDYPMFFQSDIISAMQKMKYISIINCSNFFHEWPVKRFDRCKLIVVNHRDNKQWNVAVMGFKNNFAYMQKQIDGLLKPFKFVKIYVDDMVIFNQI